MIALCNSALEWPAVVRNAVHHVAAAEPLGVLERREVDVGAGFQIDQLGHNGRRAEIHGHAVHSPAILINDGVIAVAHTISDAPRLGIELEICDARSRGRCEDLRLAPEKGELDICRIGPFDHSLARKPIVRPEEVLGVRSRSQALMSGMHLDDAFVADAGSAARRRDTHGKLVGVVEDGLAGEQRQPLAVVRDSGHCLFLDGAAPRTPASAPRPPLRAREARRARLGRYRSVVSQALR